MFCMLVYVISLIFREMFGRKEVEHVSLYFNSVPRSMFTVFRCSFGDCSSRGGMPIFEHVYHHYGFRYSAVYALFVFVVTIGLFNVISAIFVESTMAAAIASQLAAKKARMADEG